MIELPIIIVGAGIGGLSLAQGLSKHNIPFRVYEADESLTSRPQGYRVRISDEGVDSLRQNLSAKHFQDVESSCSAITARSNVPVARLFTEDASAAAPIFKPGGEAPFPLQSDSNILSADRTVLRTLLLRGIEKYVTFGRRFKSFTETADAVLVRFENEREVNASILVGADGTWSRVRRQWLPKRTLLDTEARLIFGKSNLGGDLTRQFSKEASRGLTLLQSPSIKCLLEPMHFRRHLNGLPEDYVYWVLFLRSDTENVPGDTLSRNATGIKTLTQELTSNWHPSLRCLFENPHVSQLSVLQVLSANPHTLDWTQQSGAGRITLIGDAAHAMSPTAALGATTALQDTATLLTSIRALGAVPKALREYEHQMGIYASEALKKTLIGGKAMFGMRAFEDLPRV
ncbi:putative FAD-binding domain-containing protein [Seiridium cardinale]|uniref:FAD-binding domain-containing protein n=1 Tax=Seiridium cardinale TaxID=138064 RepID=A0ABR2XLG6_9PEZI